MATVSRKSVAKTVRELYLYPQRSRGENLLRGCIWIASWIIGILLQQTSDPKALGGAYVIFAASLLLEFFSENRTMPLSRIVHGAFCSLLVIIVIGSLVLSYGGVPVTDAEPLWLYSFFVGNISLLGQIVTWFMFGSVMLAVFEVHRFIYDEDQIQLDETEATREEERKRFLDKLKGTSEGGIAS